MPTGAFPGQRRFFSARTREVSGQVVRDGGPPIARARLALIDASGQAASRGTADRRGHFRLRAPKAGRYLLVVGATGYFPQTLSITDHGRLASGIALIAVASIGGTVREESLRSPISDAIVVLARSDGAVLHAACTGPSGRYGFTALHAGTYLLITEHRLHRPTTRPVHVTAYTTEVEDITLAHRLVSVDGVVRRKDGTPAAGVHVTLIDDVGFWLAAHASPSGHFAFTAVPAGEYTLTVSGSPSIRRRLTLDLDARGFDIVLDAAPH
ncbi:collagen binding domain-containing protein [Streptomyces sp. NPDC087300]|uniref:MSCRAMM family protein n=1 Tax=Streptomyces sp. NPDC087300 TaxID=3365780 RepID=UPI0038069B46